jgi:hypothetical protein
VQDEGLNAASGLAADPRKYPWQAHARGLAAHLVFGVVTNAVLNLLKAPRPPGLASPAYATQMDEEAFEGIVDEEAYEAVEYGRATPLRNTSKARLSVH